jgi:inosine-uridine nucleoside N-ribohydrolase
MKRKIIIDTDPGIDDAMAILFALDSPELEVMGLTTIFGNVHTALATQNARRLVEFAGHPEIPVAHGADRPLDRRLDGVADFVHGANGLGDVALPDPIHPPDPRPAAQFIVETVMTHPGEITLVPVGPLTNIALALSLEPAIAGRVAGVVLMGGAATVNGNVNPAAEANIYNDPHAADRVFTAGWPLTMVGLDVTMKTVMDDVFFQSLRTSTIGDFIYKASRFYLAFHQAVHDQFAAHTHDPSAIAYLIDPTLFRVERGPVRVATHGLAAGQTLFDRRREWYSSNAWTSSPSVDVCVDVDSRQLLGLFYERITRQPSHPITQQEKEL